MTHTFVTACLICIFGYGSKTPAVAASLHRRTTGGATATPPGFRSFAAEEGGETY